MISQQDFKKLFKLGFKLRIKYWWYKYIRRLDIIGFYSGVPIIRTKYLEQEEDD